VSVIISALHSSFVAMGGGFGRRSALVYRVRAAAPQSGALAGIAAAPVLSLTANAFCIVYFSTKQKKFL
jgi:hypothetical protein